MIWLVIVGVGAGSFALRVVPLLLLERVSLGDRTDRMIRYAGMSAIAALISASARTTASGTATVPTLTAIAVAIVLAARGASIFRLLICGGAIYAGAIIVVDLVAR